MGTRPSAVATLVERTSRYPAIVALPDGIKAELNHRPRRTHGYRTPAEVYAGLLNSGDALTA